MSGRTEKALEELDVVTGELIDKLKVELGWSVDAALIRAGVPVTWGTRRMVTRSLYCLVMATPRCWDKFVLFTPLPADKGP